MNSGSSAASRPHAPAKLLAGTVRRPLPVGAHGSSASSGGPPLSLTDRRLLILAAAGGAALALGVAVQMQMQRLGASRARLRAGEESSVSAPVQLMPSLAQPNAATAAGSAGIASANISDSDAGVVAGPAVIAAALEKPVGTSLIDAATRVADTIALQQVKTLMASSLPATQPSTQALSDLASLVRQAQVSTQSAAMLAAGASGVQTADSPAVRDGIAAVQQAEAALESAVSARDALNASPSAQTGSPATSNASSVAGSPAQVAATASAPSSVRAAALSAPAITSQQIQQARSAVLTAQANLNALLAPPPADQVAAAQQAIAEALGSVPRQPSDLDLQNAQAAVDHASQVYQLALQPQVTGAIALSQAGTTRAPGAVGQPNSGGGNTIPQNPAAMAQQAKSALQSAQDRLSTLQQQAAYAANPEGDPQVIAARARLAALQAPPDPQKVAAAETAVVAAEQRVNLVLNEAMQPTPAPIASVAGLAAAGASSNPATAAAAAPTPDAAVRQKADDAVEAAGLKLSAAQDHLRSVVAGSVAAAPPAGSTVTNVTPQIGAAATDVTAANSASSASAIGVAIGLRATIAEDAALVTMGLHPSAFPVPKLATPPAAASKITSPFAWPLTGPITQPFGVPELGVGSPHTGVDIGASVGTAIRSTAAGVVSFAGGDPTGSYGYYVIVDHGQGVSSLYGHLAMPPLVLPGQLVLQGTLLGLSGSTGFSTGPHLHFEIRLNAVPADPLRLLPSGS